MGVQPRSSSQLHDFFEQVLAETTDMFEIEAKYEESFATDPWYVHLYRTSYATTASTPSTCGIGAPTRLRTSVA